jgi:ABC-2 type transport system permease protein
VSDSGIWPVAQGVAWRTLKNVVTTPSILLPSLLFPLFMFTAFAGGLSQVQNVPGFDFEDGYTTFQFVFVLLQSAAFGGVFTGFGVARDFEGGFARRLLLASPKRSGIVLGYAIAAFLRWVIVATLITVIALVVGMQVSGDLIDLIGLYSLAFLVNVCGFMWSAGIAMRFRSIQAGPLMQMPVFILLFFAPVYVPLHLLSGAMHAVASLNPLTYVMEAGRSLISGQPEEVALAFALAAVLAAALVLWAFRGLRRAEAAG